jgi:ribonucleoside-triphosphate reductase
MRICPECKRVATDYGCYSQCPKCKRNITNTEVYSRVVGFYRPVKQWNDGKQAEFRDRKEYVLREG